MYRALKNICILAFAFCAFRLTAQTGKLITIRNAESLSFDREKHDAKLLRGNVICEHEGALLHCDSALIYEEQNKMEAGGHILITRGDSIRVTGEKLVYDGKTRMAVLENNVKCVEKDMTLTTQVLTFDVKNSIANYYNGGTITHKENTLSSRNGHYYSKSKEATFHYDVVLTNPDYKMNSDTLRYRIQNKAAYFLGPSIILSKTDYIYCENGWYDTEREKAQFSRNALLVTAQQKLKGDSLVYDRIAQEGRAFRNVTLTDTSRRSIIYGDYVEYRQLRSEALVTKRPLYARVLDTDTLFIAADTLYHRDIDSLNNFLSAYHHVRVFTKDIQAVCDSAAMRSSDSLLKFFGTPLMWSGRMQASAKYSTVAVGDKRIKGFNLETRAFLIEQPDTNDTRLFNQMTGRTIEGIMQGDSIRKIIVTGNAEIYYYPMNKGRALGLNKTTSEKINIWFTKGAIGRVSMKPKTDGNIDPMRVVDPKQARLKGFNWQPERRPSREKLHTK
jgi:lipopolysaccharide export system protein LptA